MALIPFLYFTIWLIAHLKKSNIRFGVGAMSLLWIDIDSFFVFLLDIRDLYGDWGCNDYALNLGRVILYCLLWTLVLYPLTKLDDKEIQLSIQKQQLFHYLCIFSIVCGAIYIIGTGVFSNIIANLQVDRSDAYENSMDQYNNIHIGGKKQILLWAPMVITRFWPLLLLFWFGANSICQQPVWIRLGLLILSMYLMFSGYSGGGRAQTIWWIVTFMEYYCLFYPFMEKRKRSFILLVFLSIASAGILGLFAITVSRFDSSITGNILDSIIGYAGQPLNNFCAVIPYVDFAHLYPQRLFPLSNFLVTHNIYNMVDYYEFLGCVYPLEVNVFFTLFGELLLDSGVIGLLLFMFIYYFTLIRLSSVKNGNLEFYQLLIVSIIICIPIRGIFAWPFLGNITETLGIIYVLILYVLFKYTFKFKS